MKFKSAMHFFVAAMIAFGVASCGGDKNTAPAAPAAPAPTTTTVTSVTANPGQGALTKDEFYNEVANNRFDEASQPGLYSFPKNNQSGGGFDFDFCWGYEDCMEQQLSKSQSQVNSAYWRFLDSNNETIYRNFTANGLTYTSPPSDDDFGGTVTSLKQSLLNIINSATRVEKYDYYTGWTQVQSGLTAVPYNQGSDLSHLFGGGSVNNNGQRSKVFRFYSNGRTYIIDLTKALIKNPTAVY
jgi:hypothetical protein